MVLNNKNKLFEMMEKINPDFKNNNSEQAIIDDILSMNEGLNDIVGKLINYGKNGLLTATIVLAVAFSAQAQQQHKTNEIIKQGVMSVDSTQQKQIYAFMIGCATESASLSMQKGDIDAAGSFKEISKYYQALRDGIKPLPLSEQASKYLIVLENMYKNLDINTINHFITDGISIHQLPD